MVNEFLIALAGVSLMFVIFLLFSKVVFMRDEKTKETFLQEFPEIASQNSFNVITTSNSIKTEKLEIIKTILDANKVFPADFSIRMKHTPSAANIEIISISVKRSWWSKYSYPYLFIFSDKPYTGYATDSRLIKGYKLQYEEKDGIFILYTRLVGDRRILFDGLNNLSTFYRQKQ